MASGIGKKDPNRGARCMSESDVAYPLSLGLWLIMWGKWKVGKEKGKNALVGSREVVSPTEWVSGEKQV